MRKAFVCFYEAHPPVSGAAMVSFCSARYATGERLLLQVCHRDADEAVAPGLRVRSIAANARSRTGKILGLPSRLARVVRELEGFDPEVVVLEGASWAVYHRLLVPRLRRALPRARLVYHAHNVEYRLREAKHGLVVRAITRRAEGALLAGVDRSYAVSDVDAGHFRDLYGVETDLWPNGVDVGRFRDVPSPAVEEARRRYGLDGPTLLFMGLYGYGPNTEAVDFLCREVMPRIVRRVPEARLLVTGGDVPSKAPWLLVPGVIPFGDLAAVVKACAVGLAPIFSGSGTRLKILEYMAAKIPVVSTRKGAEGLGAEEGVHLEYAEDAASFADAVVGCLSGDTEAMRGRALDLVEARYAWPVALERFETWCRGSEPRLS